MKHLKNLAPALIVLLVGAGITGGIIAHRRGLLFPGSGVPEGACSRHGIPAADCPFCNRGLVERLGTCGEHGVPEALCTRCRPQLEAAFRAEGDWCGEHGLPESQCVICGQGRNAAKGAEPETAAELPAPPIETFIAEDTPQRLRPPAPHCRNNDLRIRLAGPDVARRIGLEVARVERRPLSETITATAESAFDGNRHVRLAARAPGVIREVRRDLGDRVEAGDVLAVIDSTDLGTAKAEYLAAQALVSLREKNHTREQGLHSRGASSQKEVLEAETRLAESRIALARAAQRLRSLGLDEEKITAMARDGDTSPLLPLAAPFAGAIVERNAVAGELADITRILFAIADTSRLWVLIDLREAEMGRVRPGCPAVFKAGGLRGEVFAGAITWVSSAVDPRTRAIPARAEVENPGGLLLAGMFGEAVITIGGGEPVLAVPRAAVQWEGCCNVAFIRRTESLYEPRRLRLGIEAGEYLQAVEGLEEGDLVVTTGSFLLKTEILKGSIGAGCCEPAPGR